MTNFSHANESSDTSEYSADYSNPRSPTTVDGRLSKMSSDVAEMVSLGIRAAMPGVVAQIKEAVTREIREAKGKLKPGPLTKRQIKRKRNLKNRLGGHSDYIAKKRRKYLGSFPKCYECNFHHIGECPTCDNCGRKGHYVKYCREGAKEGVNQEEELGNKYSGLDTYWVFPKVEPTG